MSALAADVGGATSGISLTVPLKANAADTYYRGSIVYIDTGGGAQLTVAAGDRVAGISTEQKTVAVGDLVEVLIFGAVWLPVGTNVAAADEGEYLVNDGATDSDNPADMVSFGDITPAANDAIVGKILRVEGSEMLVAITPGVTGLLVTDDDGTGDISFK